MEVKSNYGGAKGSLENESALSRIQNELKRIIFRVFFLILKDEDQSVAVGVFLMIIQFFQFCTLIFQRHMYHVWKNPQVSQQLQKFFSYFMFTPYFEMLDFSSLASLMYAIIGVITLNLIILLLLGYNSSSRNSLTWPIFVLKFFFTLFTSIFYLPILDVLFEVVNCDYNTQNQLVNALFNEQCWVGTHIIHGSVAIFGIVLFCVITITINLLYYEARYSTKCLLSKVSGRAKTLTHFYILIVLICYISIDQRHYDYVIIYVILVGAFVSFWKLHVEQPYNHVFTQKVVSMQATLVLWSAILLCFTKYLEENIFHGTVYAWLVGLPLMAVAVYNKQKYDYDLLLLNINKVEDADLIVKLTNYIQKLLSRYQTDQHFNIMLNALIEVHKTTCPKDDCVLKSKKQINQRLLKNKDENLSTRDYQIHLLLGEIYSSFIRQHQNQVKLKLNYAFYLLDITKQKQQALNEFISIDSLSPSLDNEFVVFRFKKIIEDELNAAQNENLGGNIDVASELAFQNHMRSFQNKIERATLMHMDFWSQLQEDNPDLGKMNDIGAKINAAITQVEELWNKMQKMTSNLPKAMRLYGKFIIEVLQDKDYGEDLLERAKVLQTQNNKMKNKQQISVFSSEDLSFEPLPTVLVSTSQEKFVQITNINLSVSNLFGYHKTELLNRKINLLMPSIYSKFHDAHVEKFIQSSDTQKLINERLVYLKLKSGYIIPSYLYLKVIQSLEENIQIVAQFRTQRTFKTSCYLLLDSDEVIEQISSSCICNLFIDQKMINQKKVYITELFPTFNKTDYLNKQGGVISLNLQTPFIANSNYLQYYQGDLEDQTQILFQLQVTEIDNEHQDQVVGYILKMERLTNEQSQILTPEMKQQLSVPNQIVNNFQFKYFVGKSLYVGENSEELNSARVDQTVIWEQSSRVSEETQADQKQKVEEITIPRINYAEGIRTLKLFENRVQDLEDIRMSFSEGDEVQHSSIFQQNKENQEENDLGAHNNIFRNRKSLNSAINNYKTPQVVVYLNCAINFLILCLIAMSFTAYFLSVFEFQNAKTNLDLVHFASQRNAECAQIVTNVQNLEMLKIGIWNLTESEATLYEQQQRTELNASIYKLTDVNTKLMLNDLFVSSKLTELHSQSVVTMRISENTYAKYDIVQGTQQIISKALLVRDKSLSEITKTDEDIKFLTYNLFNDIVIQYRNETNLYTIGFSDRLQTNLEAFLIILIISAVLLFVFLLIIIILLIKLNSIQQQILQLFIDIPEKTVKYLYNKSENFISNLQVGEEEEISSDLSDAEQDEQSQELQRTLKSKRRRKMFKNTNSFQRTQILIALLLVIVFQGYYVLDYFLNKTISDNIDQQLQELNVTARCESFYRLVDNAERQLFLNRSDPILLKDAYTQVTLNIQQNYQVDSSLHQEHALNSGIMNSAYYDTFQNLFMYDPCSLLVSQGFGTTTECESFAQGSVQQGMAVAIARYFESVRYLMTIYDLFYGHPEANFSTIARGWGKFRNITNDSDNVTNFIYNLNNFQQAVIARQMQNTYIKGAFRYLLSEYIQALKDDIGVTQTQLLAFFIVFDVLLFLCYFIIWIPSSWRLTRDIWRTKGLIMMIPLRVIQRIKTIKEFVNNLVHVQDSSR